MPSAADLTCYRAQQPAPESLLPCEAYAEEPHWLAGPGIGGNGCRQDSPGRSHCQRIMCEHTRADVMFVDVA